MGMKLTSETLEVLKNFAKINSNILIKPGSKINTISPIKSVVAEATVDCNFDVEFGIWDLNQFLATVSLFEEPEIDFDEKYLTIRGKNGASVKYYYCEPKLLSVVSKSINMPATVYTFELKEDRINELIRAASVLQVSDICIQRNGDEVEIAVTDRTNVTSNNFTISIGPVPEDLRGYDFSFYIKADYFKMIPGDYTVSISEQKISEFVHATRDIKYYLALESDSVFKSNN
jgi:hypothetical protein